MSFPTHKKPPRSLASTRGENWGLPQSAPRSVAATRPILIHCYGDRLVVVPEVRGRRPRQIVLKSETQDAMDELISAVWDHMESWGKAGRGLYWRPVLTVEVKPGGEGRFAEMQALMAGSGVDIEKRGTATAGRQGATPNRN